MAIALAVALLGIAFGRGGQAGASPPILAGLTLRDQRGELLSARRLAAKILLLNFIFTRCGTVCPTQTRELVRLIQSLPPELAGRVQLLSISLDPEHDGPAELARFARQHAADRPDWYFAAGDAAATRALVLKLRPDAAERDTLQHDAALYLFDREGRLLQHYAGAPLDTTRIARDIAQLDRMN